MIYLLFGENEYELNKYIYKLSKENNIETKITYNYNECKIEDVIEECGYFDLFGNKKIVILNEAIFLTSKNTLESKVFDNYIASPNENTILVLKIITDKLDERKKLVKTLKEKSKVVEFKLPEGKEIDTYIKDYFKSINYKIDSKAINEISTRLSSNTKVLRTELEKLELYKQEEKEITEEDVKKVIVKYDENIIFKLVDAVIKKDKPKIFSLYKNLIEEKEEPTIILITLANQFRLMYQANVLASNGMDKYKIGSFLKEHPFRVELSIKNSHDIEEKELIKILKELAEIDIKIKTGQIDKTAGLETFLIEL